MGAERITAGIQEAQKKLSRLISQVEKGHPVAILRRGKPVVEIVPVGSESELEQLRSQHLQERKKLLDATREFAARVRSHIVGEKLRLVQARSVRLSERRLRQVLESASEAVLEADAEGKVLLANRAAEKMFGLHPERTPGSER